ncbi:MAG: translation elongation factor Ts [Clostridia bacterium]|nr:translation elongation factor Ts [Clostridia bacterium]MDD7701226.1 translation elongation factor Ts [Eubacteriales bacterium]MDY2827537.1 translation elongation factor Ts [Eubacteriales bacterium]
MATITAKDVAALRAQTGLGMMDCKKALVEAEGDMEKAVKILREKGLATAEKKAGRIAAEGRVDIMTKDGVTAMVEVNSETDFAAKSDAFKEFVTGVLATLIEKQPATVAELMEVPYNGTEETVQKALIEKIAMIKENLQIRRFVIIKGITSSYIHGFGTTGVVVKFDTDAATAAKPEFAAYAKNIALQVAAGNPPQYVNISDVPASAVAEEKAVLVAQMKNDPKNANKPDAILEKIVSGRLGKFYERVCLVEQAYIKEDSITVGQYTKNTEKELGATIKIVSFDIYEKGEGIEKKEDNFVDEILKLSGHN